MRHKFLVLTVKKFLQSVYIYGSYRKIKTGVPFFLDHPVHGTVSNVDISIADGANALKFAHTYFLTFCVCNIPTVCSLWFFDYDRHYLDF